MGGVYQQHMSIAATIALLEWSGIGSGLGTSTGNSVPPLIVDAHRMASMSSQTNCIACASTSIGSIK